MDNECKHLMNPDTCIDCNGIDKIGMEQWLDSFSDAIDILMDIYNGDYTVEAFRDDVREHFEPDDRGDINR
mgnify:CR=1 FL=1